MIKRYLLVAKALLVLILLSCTKEDTETPTPGAENVYLPIALESPPATEDMVIYEVNLRAFPGGNLRGVINQLDHIASLGTNVIWLMPIYPNGTVKSVNSPYSIRDYTAVSSEYGSLADLRALTNAAHTKGIAVILDWVANHTAWDHPWVEKHPDWYTQNAAGEIIHPPGTNWEDVADLNFENIAMRDAMIQEMHYWLDEANIDGFRCDYADGVPEDFWKEAITQLEALEHKDLIWLAEGDRDDHFSAGFDLIFGWSWYSKLIDVFNGTSVAQLFLNHNTTYSGIAPGKHILRFTTNHDESAWHASPVEVFKGQNGALAAFGVTLFTGGVPLIYGSQEVGTESTVPFFYNSEIAWQQNPEVLSAYRELLRIYTNHTAARTGTNTFYNHPNVACFSKATENEEVLVLINLRGVEVTYGLASALHGKTFTNAISESPENLTQTIRLNAYEYRIWYKTL